MNQSRGPKYRPSRPLPPMHGVKANLKGITVVGYHVGSWCRSSDGSGDPEAVCLQLDTMNPSMALFLQLKSPAAVDEMIAALERHKMDVWPDCKADQN